MTSAIKWLDEWFSLIVQTPKFLIIDATAVTLHQGHGNVIQYILPEGSIHYVNMLINTLN